MMDKFNKGISGSYSSVRPTSSLFTLSGTPEVRGKITQSVVDSFKNINILKTVGNSKKDHGDGNPTLSHLLTDSSSGYTKILTQNKTYDWTIENIRNFCPASSSGSLSKRSDGFIDIRSPSFSVLGRNPVTNWHLFIRFGEFKECMPVRHTSIWLVLEDSCTKNEVSSNLSCSESIKASFEIRIVNERGHVEQVQRSGCRSFNLKKDNNTTPWGFEKFIPYHEFEDEDSKLFSGNKLRIKLDLKLFEGSVNFPFPKKRLQGNSQQRFCDDGSGDYDASSSTTPQNDMTKAISSMWKDTKFSDIQIIVGDMTFTAHRAILAARSKVFAKMLSPGSFSEGQSNEIVLEGLSSEIVEGMLQFIYTDQTEIPSSIDQISELLEGAEMYQLSSLKQDCYFELVSQMSINNAAKIAVIAYYFKPSEDIVAVIKNFLQSNLSEIKSTRCFKDMYRKHHPAFYHLLSTEAYHDLTL